MYRARRGNLSGPPPIAALLGMCHAGYRSGMVRIMGQIQIVIIGRRARGNIWRCRRCGFVSSIDTGRCALCDAPIDGLLFSQVSSTLRGGWGHDFLSAFRGIALEGLPDDDQASDHTCLAMAGDTAEELIRSCTRGNKPYCRLLTRLHLNVDPQGREGEIVQNTAPVGQLQIDRLPCLRADLRRAEPEIFHRYRDHGSARYWSLCRPRP